MPLSVIVGAADPQAVATGEDGELETDSDMFATVQVTVNPAKFEVTASGLVMTILPDPDVLSEAAVTVREVTARVPAPVNVSVWVGPLPPGRLQW